VPAQQGDQVGVERDRSDFALLTVLELAGLSGFVGLVGPVRRDLGVVAFERGLTPAGLGEYQLVDVQFLGLAGPGRRVVDAGEPCLKVGADLGDRGEQPQRPGVVDNDPPIDADDLARRGPLDAWQWVGARSPRVTAKVSA